MAVMTRASPRSTELYRAMHEPPVPEPAKGAQFPFLLCGAADSAAQVRNVTVHAYRATAHAYRATAHAYRVTAHAYRATAHVYRVTAHVHRATAHAYRGTTHAYRVTTH